MISRSQSLFRAICRCCQASRISSCGRAAVCSLPLNTQILMACLYMKTNRGAHKLLLCNAHAAIGNGRPQTPHGLPSAPGHKTDSVFFACFHTCSYVHARMLYCKGFKDHRKKTTKQNIILCFWAKSFNLISLEEKTSNDSFFWVLLSNKYFFVHTNVPLLNNDCYFCRKSTCRAL